MGISKKFKIWVYIFILLPIVLSNQNCANPQPIKCSDDNCNSTTGSEESSSESEDNEQEGESPTSPTPPPTAQEPEPLPAACVFNNNPVIHGDSIIAYSQAASNNCNLAAEERVCNNGSLSGSFAFASCTTNLQNKSCLFNGNTIPHLGAVTAYSSATVPVGSTCSSEVRTCSNGNISGTFSNTSCKVQSVVSSSSELKQALTLATGGEVILVKPNTQKYDVQVSYLKPTSKVLITAFDPSNRPTFETLKLNYSQNFHFDSFYFNSTGSSRAEWLYDIFIENSSNIAISNTKMFGNAVEYRKTTSIVGENAVLVSNVDGFQFQNNEVSHYNFAISSFKSSNHKYFKNNLHHMQGDGMIFSDAQNVTIEENSFHDFFGSLHSLNHTDLIQFYTSDLTRQSRDIIIRKNIFLAGSGSWSQVIFMGNEAVRTGKAGREMYYKNVLIEENLVHNNTWHGITIYSPDGLRIRKNAVFLHKTVSPWESTNDGIYIQVAGTMAYDAIVEKNISQKYALAPGTVSIGNITVNYSSSSNTYYAPKLFKNPTADSAATIASFEIIKNSAIDTLGVGPTLIQSKP